MLPARPARVIPSRVWSPLETLKPANSITASLGIGMQARARRHQQEDPASPVLSMTLTQKSTIGPVRSAKRRIGCTQSGGPVILERSRL